MSPCECLVIKELQKQRMSFDSHKYAPPFLYLRQSNRLAFLFFPPQFTLKNRPTECPASYRPHQNRIELLTCSDFSESTCVTFDFRHSAYLITNQRLFITIFPAFCFKPQSIPDEIRTADKNRQFLQRIDLI